MTYMIFKNGVLVNTIVADESFCNAYCDANGYTYMQDERQEPQSPHIPTTDERITELEKENARLKAQNELQAQQQTFLEDCILEMGNVVYA